MSLLFRILASLFVLRVGDAPDPQADLALDAPAPAGDTPAPAGDPEPDPVTAAADDLDTPAPALAEPSAADLRADAAERRANEAETRLREASRSVPQPSEEQRIREAEEVRLRDPNTTPTEKWQIESNRVIRATNAAAQTALAQSMDNNDRSAFAAACQTNKRFAHVQAEVETTLAAMRAKGNNAPREELAYYLLGKKVAAAQTKGKTPTPAPSAHRGGKTPGVRTDVQAKGALTERQKRAARLENVQI